MNNFMKICVLIQIETDFCIASAEISVVGHLWNYRMSASVPNCLAVPSLQTKL